MQAYRRPCRACSRSAAELTEAQAHQEQGLGADSGVNGPGIELVQVGVQHPQALLRVVVPIEPEAGVAGMVEAAVEGLELLIGQLGDDGGVPPTVHGIGVVGEHGCLGDPGVRRVGGAVHALHLVEHHALEGHGVLQAQGTGERWWCHTGTVVCCWDDHLGHAVHRSVKTMEDGVPGVCEARRYACIQRLLTA